MPSSERSVAVRVAAKVAGPDALDFAVRLAGIDPPRDLPSGSAVIEVRSAGVNPSDVKALLGAMPDVVWPRTPGRDYAGVVVDGPRQLIGKEVWGSGGELGIRRDGTHARYFVLPAVNLREKPARISLAEAGAVGVPFVTANEGLREAGPVQEGDVVLVLGANGKVGQAVIQLATAAGHTCSSNLQTRCFRRQRFAGHGARHMTAPDHAARAPSDSLRATPSTCEFST